MVIPAPVVDALPLSLWKPANLHLGGRLHFCAEDSRTVEWNGKVIGRGRRVFPFDEIAKLWPDDAT